jgi:hypothetical protein
MYVPNIKGKRTWRKNVKQQLLLCLTSSLVNHRVPKKHLPNPVNKRLNMATMSSSLYLTFEKISLNTLKTSVPKKHLPNPVNKRLNMATMSSSLYLTFENISLNSLKVIALQM